MKISPILYSKMRSWLTSAGLRALMLCIRYAIERNRPSLDIDPAGKGSGGGNTTARWAPHIKQARLKAGWKTRGRTFQSDS